VRVADAPPGAPAILGTVSRGEPGLRFTPRYPFQPGVAYTAESRLPLKSGARVPPATFTVPAARRALRRHAAL
jgi:hypothetical protein